MAQDAKAAISRTRSRVSMQTLGAAVAYSHRLSLQMRLTICYHNQKQRQLYIQLQRQRSYLHLTGIWLDLLWLNSSRTTHLVIGTLPKEDKPQKNKQFVSLVQLQPTEVQIHSETGHVQFQQKEQLKHLY